MIYEVNTETELAIRYNDKSVLENMHIALAWKLLKKSDSNIFKNLSREERRRFRQVLIESVHYVDTYQLLKHSETLNSLVESKNNPKYESDKWANESLPVALHTADMILI